MSNKDRKTRLIERIGRNIQALQEATDALDEAAAEVLGVNRTDMRILSILDRCGAMRPSLLSAEANLSRPATTTAIDRLERAGLVRREASRVDRRSSNVVMTAHAAQSCAAIYGPLGAEGQSILAGFTPEELDVIRRFLEAATDLQKRHTARLGAPRSGSPG